MCHLAISMMTQLIREIACGAWCGLVAQTMATARLGSNNGTCIATVMKIAAVAVGMLRQSVTATNR